ncbi:DUF2570 domain-containing protein [Yersinia mollaretii]|uniref:DUF2570 domain-containing protein n=1 Tax=Yersinia mollaretii TaxID=33060 RepID=UPI0005DFDAF7|nr:DUF2570 domain-containing protein [Yersinia mollaretii]MDN0112897.1 DUF2570 domain-containing protein [Yersinia mollaretii]PJE88190.1 DUF2570 domain-containing protein [Yersinia mollaretii]CQD35639.1 Preprotein translocase subunit SecA [Yersinia mollaretii]CQH27273.1 Preprotein translocase subunit SecA [Yersinia mollaretii]
MSYLRIFSILGKTILSLVVVAIMMWLVQTGRTLEKLNMENVALNKQIVQFGEINQKLNNQILLTTAYLQKAQELDRVEGEKSSELQKRLRAAQKGHPCADEPVPADVIRMQQQAIGNGK